MVECEVITLNGVEYAIVDNLVIDDVNYLYLSNIANAKDCCIKKAIMHGEDKMIEPLKDKEEFDKVLIEFQNKYK